MAQSRGTSAEPQTHAHIHTHTSAHGSGLAPPTGVSSPSPMGVSSPRPWECPRPRPWECPRPRPWVCPHPRPWECPHPRPWVCPRLRPWVCPRPRPWVCPHPRPWEWPHPAHGCVLTPAHGCGLAPAQWNGLAPAHGHTLTPAQGCVLAPAHGRKAFPARRSRTQRTTPLGYKIDVTFICCAFMRELLLQRTTSPYILAMDTCMSYNMDLYMYVTACTLSVSTRGVRVTFLHDTGVDPTRHATRRRPGMITMTKPEAFPHGIALLVGSRHAQRPFQPADPKSTSNA